MGNQPIKKTLIFLNIFLVLLKLMFLSLQPLLSEGSLKKVRG